MVAPPGEKQSRVTLGDERSVGPQDRLKRSLPFITRSTTRIYISATISVLSRAPKSKAITRAEPSEPWQCGLS